MIAHLYSSVLKVLIIQSNLYFRFKVVSLFADNSFVLITFKRIKREK